MNDIVFQAPKENLGFRSVVFMGRADGFLETCATQGLFILLFECDSGNIP